MLTARWRCAGLAKCGPAAVALEEEQVALKATPVLARVRVTRPRPCFSPCICIQQSADLHVLGTCVHTGILQVC